MRNRATGRDGWSWRFADGLRTFCGLGTLVLVDELEDAVPRCPRCLVLLDVEGPVELPHLECPSCGDLFL